MITNLGQADSIVRDGSADMIAIGRQFIRDPWVAYQAADCLAALMSVPTQYL